MAAPTIEQALQLSDELADDDLENLLSALDARGFRGDHRAGRTFQRFNAESLIPPLTKRQAGLLTTVQEILALETGKPSFKLVRPSFCCTDVES